MNSGFFDVLHYAADIKLLAVIESVDVDLNRVVKKPVYKQRMGWSNNSLVCDSIEVINQ